MGQPRALSSYKGNISQPSLVLAEGRTCRQGYSEWIRWICEPLRVIAASGIICKGTGRQSIRSLGDAFLTRPSLQRLLTELGDFGISSEIWSSLREASILCWEITVVGFVHSSKHPYDCEKKSAPVSRCFLSAFCGRTEAATARLGMSFHRIECHGHRRTSFETFRTTNSAREYLGCSRFLFPNWVQRRRRRRQRRYRWRRRTADRDEPASTNSRPISAHRPTVRPECPPVLPAARDRLREHSQAFLHQ